ncbi:MAG: hypothetical protein HZA91_12580 [Verrucomicrobia bacterium]|nr:hypothetical protein [Verrucomicrobiota bacterium]
MACVAVFGVGLLTHTSPASSADAPPRWENYVSKHCTFTLLKPAGWVVKESYQDKPRLWACHVTDPNGRYQATTMHGLSPTGRDADALVREIVAQMVKLAPDLQLAPTAKMRKLDLVNSKGEKTGEKKIFILEGTYTDPQKRKRQFRTLVSGGDGFLLNQRIEAAEGRLAEAAPLLLQILANLRVAKGIYTADEGGQMAQPPPIRAQPVQLVPQQLASGWAKFGAPAGWQTADLGNGMCIVTDPAQRLYFLVGGSEFIAPRYYVRGVAGVLCSEFRSPSDAFAFAAVQNGLASNFRPVFVKQRNDLLQPMRAFAGPLRPVAVEDFSYTCTMKGLRYTSFSTGGCSGDAMRASWRLWHFTIMAPADEFDAALPTLAAIAGSYELNKEMAGRRIAENMARYYAGLRNLSNTIARNSEQMRRENLELFMERGRVQDYVSYQTTRMIMGDYDYLAGSSGYVRGDPSGLYTAEGQKITSEPYGESITRHMQEINSRPLFEAIRPH